MKAKLDTSNQTLSQFPLPRCFRQPSRRPAAERLVWGSYVFLDSSGLNVLEPPKARKEVQAGEMSGLPVGR